MPSTPPIGIKKLLKDGVLNDDDFYRKVSEKANYLDEEVVRMVHRAMVRVVNQELREKAVSRLPHLGTFALVPQKPKSQLVGKRRMILTGLKILRFYPMNVWRLHLNAKNHGWGRD